MDINTHLNRLKESFLHAASRHNRLDEVASLLSMGADVDWVPEQSNGNDETSKDTALLASVRFGHIDIAKLLLSHGASTSCKTATGETVMHLCAKLGDGECVKDLMTLLFTGGGVDVDALNDVGETAIGIATKKDFRGVCKVLDCMKKSHKANSSGSRIDNNLRNNSTRRSSGDLTSSSLSTVQLPSLSSSISAVNLTSSDGATNILRRTIDESRARERNNGPSNSSNSRQAQVQLQQNRANEHVYDDGTDSSESYDDDDEEDDGEESEDEDDEHATTANNNQNASLSQTNLKRQTQNHNSAMTVAAWHKAREDEGILSNLREMHTNKTTASNTNTTTKPVMSINSGKLEVKKLDSLNGLPLQDQITQLKRTIEELTLQSTQHKHQSTTQKQHTLEIEKKLFVNESTLKRVCGERDGFRLKSERLSGGGLSGLTLKDLDHLESTLKGSLNLIGKAKDVLLKNQQSSEDEKRLCVVCQESVKSVLLMPCRHMCLCRECSRRKEVDKCPLCRERITQKIDVYA